MITKVSMQYITSDILSTYMNLINNMMIKQDCVPLKISINDKSIPKWHFSLVVKSSI